MKRASILLFACAVIIFGILLYLSIDKKTDKEQAKLVKIKVQLQWFPGSQFAGLYAALDQKYFEAEGLDVELIAGGFGINPFDIVRGKRADIGIATGDQVLIQSYDKKEFMAFGTVFNRSIACFMAKKGKVSGLEGFKGKTVGVYRSFDTENILLAMLKQHNINTNELKIVDASILETFYKDEINIFPSYRINEPITAKLEKNLDVDLFNPEDYGVQFYSDTYFATSEYFKNNKDVLKKFIKASAKGWDYAKKNQALTLKAVLNYNKNLMTKENEEKERLSLQEAIKYLGDGNNNQIHFMDKNRWKNMEKLLFGINKVNSEGNIEAICDFTMFE